MTYTNSPLVTDVLLSSKHSVRRHKIDTVTVHCFVGQVTAQEGLEFFRNTPRKASANYVVGRDGSIGLCVEEKYRAWTSGGSLKAGGMTGSENDHRAVTIEVACDPEHPFAVTTEAYAALIRLLADICRRNGIEELKWRGDKTLVGQIDKQNMTVHRWFDNRACPGDFLYRRHGELAREVNYILKNWEEEMTAEEVKKIARQEIEAYLEGLKSEPADQWAEDDLAWAKDKGIMKGNNSGGMMPKALLTRQEAASMMHRMKNALEES